MPYMAIGSRQILFSESISPASPRDDIVEVANLSDNRGAADSNERVETDIPSTESSPEVHLDYYA